MLLLCCVVPEEVLECCRVKPESYVMTGRPCLTVIGQE